MSVAHPPPNDFALYVLSALDAAAQQRLEQHVQTCAPCAARLADEARFEMKLQELVPQTVAAQPMPVILPLASAPAPRRLQLARPLLALAAAAALLLVLGTRHWTGTPHLAGAPALFSPMPVTAWSEAPAEPPLLLCALDRSGPLCKTPVATADVLFDAASAALPWSAQSEDDSGSAPWTRLSSLTIQPACYATP